MSRLSIKSSPSFGSRLGLLCSLVCLLCALVFPTLRANAAPGDYFRITVVDDATGRGVPLVELRTTSQVTFYTDSNGVVAINDPELMGQEVYFSVKSHGYEVPADGFGNRGQSFRVTPGGQGQIKIKRLNIAERLYRITGSGIYRDSLLLGLPIPIQQPLLSGLVMGQDTVMATPYRGKIYWFWGDTNRPAYPLGNFATSGAISPLTGPGSLSPDVGINLTYWVDENGFSKKMVPLTEPGGPIWVGGLFTVTDNGQERLLVHYAHLNAHGNDTENGLAMFNDEKAVFERVRTFDSSLYPDGYPFHVTVGGQAYIYTQCPSSQAFPLFRMRADMQHVTDPSTYEGYTCLAPGSRFDGRNTRLDRSADGHLIYGWKANTAPLSFDQRKALVDAGLMKPEESSVQLRDVDTDAIIQSHGGSVAWNPYRHRWVLISGQAFGSPSYLGELWFSEADTPVGPWVYARKIITHDHYTFYNPVHHPFFDQDGGRQIYFEGTYVTTYSGNEHPTPRYDYNQIMYRLTLDDPRLTLPVPVYALQGANGRVSYAMRDIVDAIHQWPQVKSIPFFAVPPSRSHEGLIPIYQAGAAPQARAGMTVHPIANLQPLFYALPATPAATEKPSPALVPLYEYRDTGSNQTTYSTDANAGTPTMTRSEQPICRVWRNPSSVLALDTEAIPQ